MLLHDCLLSLCDFLSIDKFSKNAFQLRIGKNSTTHLYNDAIKRENFFEKKKKIVKITKWSHAFKGYASFYNAEILNLFSPELQLKDTEPAIKIKLNILLSELKGFKFVTALALELYKINKRIKSPQKRFD